MNIVEIEKERYKKEMYEKFIAEYDIKAHYSSLHQKYFIKTNFKNSFDAEIAQYFEIELEDYLDIIKYDVYTQLGSFYYDKKSCENAIKRLFEYLLERGDLYGIRNKVHVNSYNDYVES